MYTRAIADQLRAALADTPVVLLLGPRQAGKSTLARTLATDVGFPARYVTFDDHNMLAAARRDAAGLVATFEGPVILDEIQRVPELFLSLKAAVDADRRPGRFLLTGSANVLLAPQAADALAGRMEVAVLWPLSQAELEGRDQSRIVDLLFTQTAKPPTAPPLTRESAVDRLVVGGFPEAVSREDDDRRAAWFSNYVTTIMERDVRGLADIDRIEQMPALLDALAIRTRGPVNKTSIGQDLGVPNVTLDRYLALLEKAFLTKRLPAWSGRVRSRLVKSPKILLTDTGLMCHVLGQDRNRLLVDPIALGLALENHVGMELVKAAGSARLRPSIHHYRTSTGREIDFLLEAPDGRVAAVEVKSSATVGDGDFTAMEHLRDQLGDRFARGVVIYLGDSAVPFGDRLAAWPLSVI